MDRAGHPALPVGVGVVGLLCLALAGCVAPAPMPPPLPDVTVVDSGRRTTPAPAVPAPAVAAVPAPAAAPAPRIPEPAAPLPVAILYSAGAQSQLATAMALRDRLAERGSPFRLIDVDAVAPSASVDAAPAAAIVTAIGPAALDHARRNFAGAGIVYCQVLPPVPASAHGIAAQPPPTLQLAAWASVDPRLRRIGLITGARLASAMAGAAEAAHAIGAELDHRISTSDRETLYIFRRLAPGIDGLWLAPDSEVLSTAVIDEMLRLAAELDISVLVFSDGLLARGGLISVSAPAAHVVDRLVATIDAIRAGNGDSLPAEAPLEAGVVRVNAEVAAALGLPRPNAIDWVIHEQR